ncbi:unnamed protein product, partial [Gongylonema pulchrum]|uniref:RMI1_N domain-containing protein n=1 Tax=Gongylonema pulchrum TaxID=637853 RepID=A0A183EWQ7_9BILA
MPMMEWARRSVVQFFSEHEVKLKEEWLNGVLSYLGVGRACTDPLQICQLAYEQWIFSDLANSTRPTICLPFSGEELVLEKHAIVQ